MHSQQLDAIHAFEQGHVEALTGVSRRFFCEGESQIDLACAAAHDALESAGLVADDIDLIVSAAAVPYQPLPATAFLPLRTGKTRQGRAVPAGRPGGLDSHLDRLGLRRLKPSRRAVHNNPAGPSPAPFPNLLQRPAPALRRPNAFVTNFPKYLR